MENETAVSGKVMVNGKQMFPQTTIRDVYDLSDPDNPKRLDHILTGLSVLTFTHTKTGIMHQLTGKEGAEYIVFTATADYQEGDTWELNGVPLSAVHFMNGEPLCVGGLITGDTVLGWAEDGTLTLFLDRPGSNENLLDNWYLLDPVNQRGQMEYTEDHEKYTIDMWKFAQTLNITTEGVQIYREKITGNPTFFQYIDGSSSYSNKTVTLSFLVKASKSGSFVLRISLYNAKNLITVDIPRSDDFILCTATVKLPDIEDGIILIAVQDLGSSRNNNPSIGDNCFIQAVKLELGPRQTLAHKDADGNWVLNDPPPDKTTELAKCQRYQIEVFDKSRSDQSYLAKVKATSEGHAYGTLPLPVTMREKGNPVVHTDCSNETPYSAFGIINNGYSSNIPITNISVYSTMNNGVVLKATGSNFVHGNDYQIYVKNTNTHHFLLDRNL